MNGNSTFWKFCAVGLLGFCVDAGLLGMLLHLDADAIAGRVASSLIAMVVTFMLNRQWSFRSDADRSIIIAFFTYLAVQLAGWITNLGVYFVFVRYTPYPFNLPIFALVMGSAVALFVNYLGAKRIVFRQ